MNPLSILSSMDYVIMDEIMTKRVKEQKEFKLCECGCGEPTRFYKGKYKQFIHNHHKRGCLNNWWKGGESIDEDGYVLVLNKTHPYRNNRNQVRKHRLVMEEYLTKLNGIITYINPNLQVHHIDHNVRNNEVYNLQIIGKGSHTRIHNLQREYKKKDMSDRICLRCNKTTTRFDNYHKIFSWYKYNDGFICRNCYQNMKYQTTKLRRRP
jgi:hypothetical protein